MSRKQEIYKDILSWALPSLRNRLSWFYRVRPLRLLSRKRQIDFRSYYEVAQFVHNLYVSILDESFTDHDIHFLNYQARAFFERNNDKECLHYSLFVYYIQELFKEVPVAMRDKLLWPGPEGDYSWARPKRGYELGQ